MFGIIGCGNEYVNELDNIRTLVIRIGPDYLGNRSPVGSKQHPFN
jgi:hypothetical protein